MSRAFWLLVAVAVVVLCVPVALGRPTVRRDTGSCTATPVRYEAGAPARLSGVPWVKVGKAVRAYLFFYSGELADGRVNQSSGTVVYTGGGTSAFSTKILWVPTRPGPDAVLLGTRLDAPGRFTQRLKIASGGVFPSIVSIPTAGCWTLTLRSGKTRASMVVQALDPPATSSCDATPVRRDTPSPIGGTIPWLTATPASAGITGTIFYQLPAEAPTATIYPGKQAPHNGNTKILWKVPNQTAGGALVVRAQRLDTPGAMPPQSFPRAFDAYPGASFPSGIDVSSTGCWLLTIRSGRAAGIAIFQSVPPT